MFVLPLGKGDSNENGTVSDSGNCTLPGGEWFRSRRFARDVLGVGDVRAAARGGVENVGVSRSR